MAEAKNRSLPSQLAKLFQMIDGLAPDSTPEEFSAFGGLFDENCTPYILSMRGHDEPSIG
jgi:hypothetical protein